MEGAPINQAAYLVDPPTPGTLAFVRLLGGLDFPVEQPGDQHGGLSRLLDGIPLLRRRALISSVAVTDSHPRNRRRRPPHIGLSYTVTVQTPL